MGCTSQTGDASPTFRSAGCTLGFDRQSGSVCGIAIEGAKPFEWTGEPCVVQIRDDLLGKTFDEKDVASVSCSQTKSGFLVHKTYRGAPWKLTETFTFADDEVQWNASLTMPEGPLRSCAISFIVPWPDDTMCRYGMKIWAPKADMPTDLCRMGETRLEHGEVTCGITFPCVAAYLPKRDAGLMMAVPFDFLTPRAGFRLGLRTAGLEAIFDWLALSPQKTAVASLVFRACGGHWRPVLGWVVNRWREWFEPKSTLVGALWGGTVAGNTALPEDEARACSQLGLSWYEIHRHFYAYGNYHPEGLNEWPSGETVVYDEHVKLGKVTVETIRKTIDTLHKVNAAAMMYIQAGGDGDVKLLPPEFIAEKVLDEHGKPLCTWHGTVALNADAANAFGKDIARQIEGMVERYPEMDGVFLDQACYNFADYAHDDGMTAINNRPCYMTGFAYLPHLERLSRLLHPSKAIIANGPHSVNIMRFADALILEVEGWLADQMQYYAVVKPAFMLLSRTKNNRQSIERMFQRCLIYGMGFSSYAHFMQFKDIYDSYVPLVKMLFGRRWVFEADPVTFPTGFEGNIFRAAGDNLLVSAVRRMQSFRDDCGASVTFSVRTSDVSRTRNVILHTPGRPAERINHAIVNNELRFEIPAQTAAGIIEVVTQ